MKYYLDTEFKEGFHKPLFGKNRHFIDLISIGIVAEDGREYYAISNEFDLNAIWNDKDSWVKENVLRPIHTELYQKERYAREFHPVLIGPFEYKTLKNLIRWNGKSNKKIVEEIIQFINPGTKDLIYDYTRHDCWAEQFYPQHFKYIKDHNVEMPKYYFKSGPDGSGYQKNTALIYTRPEFYAYYADYDWVLFCSLFGRMLDLPKGFPMYCYDLKQMLDEKLSNVRNCDFFTKFHIQEEMTLKEKLTEIKKHTQYPQQENEHNALADAKWNQELHQFILSFKP